MGPYFVPSSPADGKGPNGPAKYNCTWYAPGASGGVNIDGGTIIGTGGTAIEFAGSGNTLTLGAGYFISGIVDPQSGNNTFQLGGFGSDTFNLSSIGALRSIKASPFSTWSAAPGRSAAQAPPTGPSRPARWRLRAAAR